MPVPALITLVCPRTYREFNQLFCKDFITLEKCSTYVPNAKCKACKNSIPYVVPPVGKVVEVKKEEKTNHRDFWKELKEFAGLKASGVYPLPHYDVGRLHRITAGQRNSMATQILFGICFNIYSVENYSEITIGVKQKFALAWFNDIFNDTNVDDYQEFMNEFNPLTSHF